LRFAQLIAQIVERHRLRGLTHDGVRAQAAPDRLGGPAHGAADLFLLHLAESLPQLARRSPLRTGHVARRVLHVAFELLELTQHAVLLFGELARLFAVHAQARRLRSRRPEGLSHALLEILLLAGKPVGAAR
jgi:hypothetical protein